MPEAFIERISSSSRPIGETEGRDAGEKEKGSDSIGAALEGNSAVPAFSGLGHTDRLTGRAALNRHAVMLNRSVSENNRALPRRQH